MENPRAKEQVEGNKTDAWRTSREAEEANWMGRMNRGKKEKKHKQVEDPFLS